MFGFSARTWNRFIIICISIAAVFWVLQIGGSAIAPETVNNFAGGTGVTYSYDGDADALAGSWMKLGLWVPLLIAAISYALLRIAANGLLRGDRRQSWKYYAAERGLGEISPQRMTSVHLPVFTQGHDRDYETVLQGDLASCSIMLGATAWTTGSGKSQERHHIFFVCAELPAGVDTVFPGSSLTRFLRGISGVSLDVGSHELRLESTLLDQTCEVRVIGDGDDVRWRELFDPVMIHGLAEEYDVQWQHVGRHIAFCTGGSYHRRVPVETMDTLCMGADFVVRRIINAAKGDLPANAPLV